MNAKPGISSDRERLALVPAQLAEAIRDAIANEDSSRLRAIEVSRHRPRGEG